MFFLTLFAIIMLVLVFSSIGNARSQVNAWKRSSAHNAVILNEALLGVYMRVLLVLPSSTLLLFLFWGPLTKTE